MGGKRETGEPHKQGKDGLLEDGVSYYPASPTQLQSYEDASDALSQWQVPVLLRNSDPHQRLFVAAFDGTGNDAAKDPRHATNVAHVRDQVDALNRAGATHIRAGYVEGPGTQDDLIQRAVDGARGYTYQARLEQMYKLFAERAAVWKREDPQADIGIADIGFSRGAEQAAGFSRLVHERGIQDPSGAQYTRDASGLITHVEYGKPPLVPPGQVAQAVGLFDPVGTGEPAGRQDRRLPPSVISGLQIIAADERRGVFRSTHIIDPGQTPDGRLLGVVVAGAHADIGGSYHRDGLSARSGNLMIDYLNALSDKPFLERRAQPADPRLDVVHRSEEGMLLYRLGPRVDRLQPEGHVERLVPSSMIDKVPDPDDAEPVDQVLRDRFPKHPVPTAAPQARAPQHDPGTAPAAALDQGDAALYQALRDRLPATIGNDRVMQATLRARQEGIAPGALGGALEHEGGLWVVGTIPGYRTRIDLSQPAPPLQDSMCQLQALAAAPPQAMPPPPQPEAPGQPNPVRAL